MGTPCVLGCHVKLVGVVLGWLEGGEMHGDACGCMEVHGGAWRCMHTHPCLVELVLGLCGTKGCVDTYVTHMQGGMGVRMHKGGYLHACQVSQSTPTTPPFPPPSHQRADMVELQSS